MDETLTPEVLDELRHALEQKRRALRASLRMPPDQIGDDADIPGDEGDSSVDLQEVEVEAGAAENTRVQLAAVEHALAKFTLGTYGICEVCGRPIPLGRLRAFPEARYDVQHEAEVEAREQQG
ncbi:MAG TPA: TraR/DksA C4-type zinc finger protein [Ktedonobacterales bacterium]|nr:TraR/DksA C4-type zinc finger protein [Ktedonobacterales bacterium]